MSLIPQLAGIVKPKDIQTETKFDVILKHWLSHTIDELQDDLKSCLERWKQVNAMLREGKVVKKGKNDITEPYKYNDVASFLVEQYNISYRTAYDDIANAKAFFLPHKTKNDKEFGKGVFGDWCERLKLEAAGKGDYKSAAAFAKIEAQVKGYFDDDVDAPDYSNINLPHLIIVDDPSDLGLGFEKLDNPDQIVENILRNRKKTNLDKLIAESEIIEPEEDDAGS